MQSGDNYDYAVAVAYRYKHEDKQSTTPKNWLLIIGSAIVALPFVANAFGALSHRNTKDYSWEWLESLSGIQFTLAILSGVSALVVNTFSNIASIPLALKKLKEIWFSLHPREFNKNRWEYFINATIFILAISAGAAAVAIGWTAFLWAGPGWAAFNATASGFIFLATRVFGLVKFVEWIDRKRKQRKYIENLTYLKEKYIDDLNSLLAKKFPNEQFGASKKRDQEIIAFAFKELKKIDKDVPNKKWRNDTNFSLEYTLMFLEFVLVTLALLAILPTFGQKFFDGFQLIFSWFSSVDLNAIPIYISAVTSTFFSLATPALYLRQILTLKDVLSDAAANIAATFNDPEAKSWDKVGKVLMVPALLIVNVFACLGIYNLTESTAREPNNLYKDIIPTPPPQPSLSVNSSSPLPVSQDSTAFTIFQLSAAGGAMVTNGNFTLSKTLAHPRTIKEGATLSNTDITQSKAFEAIKYSDSSVTVNDIARYLTEFSVDSSAFGDFLKLSPSIDSAAFDELLVEPSPLEEEEGALVMSRPRSGAFSN